MKRTGGPPAGPLPMPGLARGDLRAGRYSDAYFRNVSRVLEGSARARETFGGEPVAVRDHTGWPPAGFRPGDAEVEMQFFARRAPRFIASGMPFALGLLRDGARRASRLEVRAVPEGTRMRPLRPALVVRGRYRDFAHLETPILGVLTRCSRVASNVYDCLVASRGKPIFFFPARFDLPQCQPLDGHAYRSAIAAYEMETERTAGLHVSTDAQGLLARERGGGTVPHAFVLCYLGDTAEALLAFCRHAPVAVPRVALVDTTNDCVGESVRTARRLFQEHLRLLRLGRPEEARRFVLHGVRADTAPDLRDRSVPPSRDPRLDHGVTPILVARIRAALDSIPAHLDLRGRFRTAAERYFRAVRIYASGGFDPEKIRLFESRRAPVDAYGVGSSLLRGEPNDYTADVVRVGWRGRFVVTAKTGRGPRANPDLRRTLLFGARRVSR